MGDSGYSSEAMMKQAQQIWSMLDDMAENDPAAYRKFLAKQKEERDQYMAPPEPHMCVQTSMMRPDKVPFYVNFCVWNRIPPPTADEAVKVAGSSVSQMEENRGKVAVTAVAFAHKVLEEYGRDAVNKTDQDTLIQIAFDFIEKQHADIKLDRNYKILERTHKGSLKMIQKSLTQAFDKKTNPVDEDLAKFMKGVSPSMTDSPEKLIGQIGQMAKEADQSETVTTHSNGLSEKLSGITLNPTAKENKKPLIEVVSQEKSTLPEPEYELEKVKGEDSDDSGVVLLLRVVLPGVQSVKECDLEISQDDVHLEVEGKYALKLNLPCRIDDCEATAKFVRKSSSLLIRMPGE